MIYLHWINAFANPSVFSQCQFGDRKGIQHYKTQNKCGKETEGEPAEPGSCKMAKKWKEEGDDIYDFTALYVT